MEWNNPYKWPTKNLYCNWGYNPILYNWLRMIQFSRFFGSESAASTPQWFPWFHKIHSGKPTWQWRNDKIIWRGISYRRWGWLGVWHTCLLHTTCMFTYNFILLLFCFMFCMCFGSTFNVLCWNWTYGPFWDCSGKLKFSFQTSCLFGVHETCCEGIWSWTGSPRMHYCLKISVVRMSLHYWASGSQETICGTGNLNVLLRIYTFSSP